MAGQGAEDAYITLLLNDNYLPGALVLAHSLRDAGTYKKLAVMVTLDTVSAEVITQLKTVYDYIIPAPRIQNSRPANLYLMNRPDLHSAFTKVNLWRQTQFRKLVYIDADVVAYRAPDELFDIRHPFSAVPDIGWPDIFNTGVMVLTPNMGDYYALMAMAERGISFDGADQGLLNMHFRNSYNRISFTYNVTPSAHYQYVPAYRHFQSSINMVHFIGSDKPWRQGRSASASGGPFDEMIGRWWAVYDRHYRANSVAASNSQQPPEIVQFFVHGEYQPKVSYTVSVSEPPVEHSTTFEQQHQPQTQQHHQPEQQHHISSDGQQHQSSYIPHSQHTSHTHHHEHQHHYQTPAPQHQTLPANPCFFGLAPHSARSETEAPKEQVQEHRQPSPHRSAYEEKKPAKPQPPPMEPSWDAQRQPPPAQSKPEALNFPQMHYEMSSDTKAFVPPQRYPTPPKNMYYEVPQQPPAPPKTKPPPIFPWEQSRPRASRVFASEDEPPEEPLVSPGPADKSTGEASGSETTVEPATPSLSTIPTVPPESVTSDPWSSFTLTNAWDDMPEIERYVGALQKHRRGKSQGSLSGIRLGNQSNTRDGHAESGFTRRSSTKLTDFPSEIERPSLPVTPAPVRRQNFWGGVPGATEGDHRQLLPTAEGVPQQSDWDPVAQLQKLAKQQSELLLQKFGGAEPGSDEDDGGKEVAELSAVTSGRQEEALGQAQVVSGIAKGPAYFTHTNVLSPKPVRKSPVQTILGEDDASVPRSAAQPSSGSPGGVIPEPSYHGPGLAWEKGEDVPLKETPVPPTEEERDVLET